MEAHIYLYMAKYPMNGHFFPELLLLLFRNLNLFTQEIIQFFYMYFFRFKKNDSLIKLYML